MSSVLTNLTPSCQPPCSHFTGMHVESILNFTGMHVESILHFTGMHVESILHERSVKKTERGEGKKEPMDD